MFSGINECPRYATPGTILRRSARVQDAPVVDDENISLPPFVDFRRAERQTTFHKPQGGSTSIINGFQAAGIISKESMVGG
jgi:hypothetical protein